MTINDSTWKLNTLKQPLPYIRQKPRPKSNKNIPNPFSGPPIAPPVVLPPATPQKHTVISQPVTPKVPTAIETMTALEKDLFQVVLYYLNPYTSVASNYRIERSGISSGLNRVTVTKTPELQKIIIDTCSFLVKNNYNISKNMIPMYNKDKTVDIHTDFLRAYFSFKLQGLL